MWFFREMARSEVNQDPIEGEFFAPEEGYPGALVRESIQNMLDNRSGSGDPVQARFAFGKLEGEENTIVNSAYLSDLHPHLQALAVPNRPTTGEPLSFLVVEDSGTRGLCGDETQHTDTQQEENAPKNDFYYFWRNVGRSQKGSTDRGRWGLGKTVFPASSRILSFFGLSTRRTDRRRLLMGQCVGKIHEIRQRKYAAYGYFGRIEEDGFALPIDDAKQLTEFEQIFALNRADVPGLSVVVPFPQAELTPKSILQETVRNYYLPILFGDLTVEIEDNEHAVRVDRSTITTLASELGDAMRQTISFAEEVLAQPVGARIELGLSPAGQPPSWEAASIFENVDLAALRRRYANSELLGFRVPVAVTAQVTGETRTSHFDVYLQRDPRLERGRGDFVRQGLTITRVDRPPKGAARGLVLVSDPPLSTLLGDSEGPAHTRWEERRERVKRFRYGSMTVRFVSRALRDMSELLSQPESGIDEELLKDVFFLPDEEQSETDPHRRTPAASGNGRDRNPPVNVPPLTKKPKAIDVRQLKGGFAIVGTGAATPLPELVKVSVGYLTDDNAVAYNPFDFDLSQAPIEIRAAGASYRASGNSLEIAPDSTDFSVEVSGFDVNRDLDVNAKV